MKIISTKLKCAILLLSLNCLIFEVPTVAQTGGTAASSGERFKGRLDAELAPDLVHVYQRLFEAKVGKIVFTPAIDKKAIVSEGEVYDQRNPSGKSRMFLVELSTGDTFVAVDENSNNVIEANERFPLKASRVNPNDLETIARLPITSPLYKNFPTFIQYKRGFTHLNLKLSDRLILQSIYALAYGTVAVNGRSMRFQYPFTLQSPYVSTTEGLFGVDVDGDGKIRDEQFSIESSYATNSEIVFRLGEMYVSTEKVDLVKNEITVRARTKEEYLRHDIEVGKLIPDFSFVDFEGKNRTLYEFKGKYVLIDFWGAWCIDCTYETPYHVEALKRFRNRGFDILSLNTDEKIENAKSYIQKNKMDWTHATNDSIRRLVEETYRIQEYPSTILIGPDAKVLVLDQKMLRGERLIETLERVLPKK